MAIEPSKYQIAIQHAQLTTENNMAIKATAGSGKTTTLIGLAQMLPYGKRSLFTAFNKSIVAELKTRLPVATECSTLHSLGAKAIFRHYPNGTSIDEKKQIAYIMPYFADAKPKEKWANIYQVDRVMKLARATMAEVTKEGIEKLVDDYALDFEEKNIGIVVKALRKYHEDQLDPERYNMKIDFQDMIEMIVRNPEIIVPKYDFVYCDEIQDFSKLDRLFINRFIKPKGRLIGVGDPRQSIYGFRGAAIDSFEQFAAQKNTVILPLSICYRCTKKIVREARKIYEEIEENPNGEEGLEINEKAKIEDIREGDFVLCRNTRPLIDIFFKLIESNKKAYVVGKEMEKGLLAILVDYNSFDKTDLAAKARLNDYRAKLLASLKEKGYSHPEKHPKMGILDEKIQILQMLFDKFSTVGEVENFISRIFEDEERDGIRLSTIHRAKGLENERVFVIRTYGGVPLIPSPYAATPDQHKQEKNLEFVSVTRAKKELNYLNM